MFQVCTDDYHNRRITYKRLVTGANGQVFLDLFVADDKKTPTLCVAGGRSPDAGLQNFINLFLRYILRWIEFTYRAPIFDQFPKIHIRLRLFEPSSIIQKFVLQAAALLLSMRNHGNYRVGKGI